MLSKFNYTTKYYTNKHKCAISNILSYTYCLRFVYVVTLVLIRAPLQGGPLSRGSAARTPTRSPATRAVTKNVHKDNTRINIQPKTNITTDYKKATDWHSRYCDKTDIHSE